MLSDTTLSDSFFLFFFPSFVYKEIKNVFLQSFSAFTADFLWTLSFLLLSFNLFNSSVTSQYVHFHYLWTVITEPHFPISTFRLLLSHSSQLLFPHYASFSQIPMLQTPSFFPHFYTHFPWFHTLPIVEAPLLHTHFHFSSPLPKLCFELCFSNGGFEWFSWVMRQWAGRTKKWSVSGLTLKKLLWFCVMLLWRSLSFHIWFLCFFLLGLSINGFFLSLIGFHLLLPCGRLYRLL